MSNFEPLCTNEMTNNIFGRNVCVISLFGEPTFRTSLYDFIYYYVSIFTCLLWRCTCCRNRSRLGSKYLVVTSNNAGKYPVASFKMSRLSARFKRMPPLDIKSRTRREKKKGTILKPLNYLASPPFPPLSPHFPSMSHSPLSSIYLFKRLPLPCLLFLPI